MQVVLDITEGLQGKTITCENFFTSHALGLQLLKRKLYMVGTVRRNKPELPPALVSKTDRAQFSSKFAFTKTHALVSCHPKKQKNVLLMSTLHRDAAVSNRDDKRPKIIEDYNHNKGGVDNIDKEEAVHGGAWVTTGDTSHQATQGYSPHTSCQIGDPAILLQLYLCSSTPSPSCPSWPITQKNYSASALIKADVGKQVIREFNKLTSWTVSTSNQPEEPVPLLRKDTLMLKEMPAVGKSCFQQGELRKIPVLVNVIHTLRRHEIEPSASLPVCVVSEGRIHHIDVFFARKPE
ncbi:piggyBac transposable element-derived protein 4-like protein [Lates japonicus]|uniref:PiggyBac transposable element-derived protein 4-like protein n=1 Tax=Lates japonicus TaxID=270547 RepID=A0AAD3NA94_LATJO|nr:piggyBac transposable element-derived protein 4-like protein [Lates japonicus]